MDELLAALKASAAESVQSTDLLKIIAQYAILSEFRFGESLRGCDDVCSLNKWGNKLALQDHPGWISWQLPSYTKLTRSRPSFSVRLYSDAYESTFIGIRLLSSVNGLPSVNGPFGISPSHYRTKAGLHRHSTGTKLWKAGTTIKVCVDSSSDILYASVDGIPACKPISIACPDYNGFTDIFPLVIASGSPFACAFV